MSTDTVLCVDLDGSLIRTDLLYEAVLLLTIHHPLKLLAFPGWLAQGKAVFKEKIAALVAPDAALLPYNDELLAWITEQRKSGRRVVLCTASDRSYAQGVADHVGIFDEVLASDGSTNLSGSRKAALLVERFGSRGFDYVGNSHKDLPVWEVARRAIVVGGSSLEQAAGRLAPVERRFANGRAGAGAWVRGLRLHQWLKNLLLLLPLLGAHRWGDFAAWTSVLEAFVAFGCCASGVYLVNDLVDLENDRQHERKRLRPMASGKISVAMAACVAPLLFMVSFAIAANVSVGFLAWLATYLVLTTLYTFVLKKIALVDCLALAGLYTLRVVAGGAAAAQFVSFWLLAFSLFLFLSLAYVKRYAELTGALAQGKEKARGRGYHTGDRHLLQSFGVSAGFAASLVLALYLNSDAVQLLYHNADRLWFTLPVLLYWISRMWLLASRGQMHEDPVIFAVRDHASLAAGLVFIVVIGLAR